MRRITHTNPSQILRELRDEGGLTQKDLGRISGYDQRTISYIEKADCYQRRRGGYWRTVCDLIDALGYDVVLRRRS